MRNALILTVLMLMIVGCESAMWPYGRSLDKENNVSEAHFPQTIVVIDTVTKEELLRVDVPVGKKLVMDFEHDIDRTASFGEAMPANYVRWSVVDAGDHWVTLYDHRMELSGNPIYKRVYDTRTAPPPPTPVAEDKPAEKPAVEDLNVEAPKPVEAESKPME